MRQTHQSRRAFPAAGRRGTKGGSASPDDEDRDRGAVEGELDGASEKGLGNPPAPTVSQDEEVVSPARFPAEDLARRAFEQEGLLALDGRLLQPPGVVAGHRGGQAAGGAAEQIAPLLDDGRFDVGEGTHVGDRDAGSAGSSEVAGRAKGAAGLRREIDSRENPDSRSSHVPSFLGGLQRGYVKRGPVG